MPNSFQDCKSDLAEILKAGKLNQKLAEIEKIAKRDNFDVLEGISELRVRNPIKWLKLNRLLKKTANKGLYQTELEQLVEILFELSHSESHIRLWRSGGYDEIHRHYIYSFVSKKLLNENIAEVFTKLGWLREPSQIEKFRQILSRNTNSVELLTSALFNASIWSSGAPFAIFPKLKALKAQPFPPEYTARIYEEGFDALYPFLKQHYGHTAHFEAIYGEISRYGRYIALVSFLTYLGFEIKEAFEGSKGALEQLTEELDDSEKSADREVRVQEQLDTWIQQYRENQGHDPSQQEIEDYSLILKFYGIGGSPQEASISVE